MIETKTGVTKGKRALRWGLHVLCAAVVMLAAVFVRVPAATLLEANEAQKEIYFTDAGIPYLTDLDSYYHVRLVENDLKNGFLGDSRTEEGEAWDSLRFYPEGRSADYPPAIVHVTELVWKVGNLFGSVSLEAVEFSLPVLLAAITALVGYVAGCRLGGIPGGLLSGLLAGCGPIFASRTLYGRFDTDMFTVLMELLLVLFLTEALKAKGRKRWAFVVAFALTVAAFARSWNPRYSMLFAGLTLVGGLLHLLVQLFAVNRNKPLKTRVGLLIRRADTKALIAAGVLTLVAMLIVAGPSIIGQVLSALSFSSSQQAGEGVLPNLYVSISELKAASLLPKGFLAFFLGYVPDQAPAAVNGVGGGIAFLMSVAGLVRLGLLSSRSFRKGKEGLPPRPVCELYLCVLGVWFLAGLILFHSGVRFVYHLSVPVSLLAAFDLKRAGHSLRILLQKLAAKCAKPGELPKTGWIKAVSVCLVVLLFLGAMLPAVTGSLLSAADSRPTVSDASAKAMAWLKENAVAPDAVVASWWDMGYFYEYASGLPCLWDGGSQDRVRAILVSKALTSNSLKFSHRLLHMLSSSGNAAIDLLMEHLDPRTAFESLWAALVADEDQAQAVLENEYGLAADVAAQAAALIHPAEKKEMYLVLTYTMTRQIGWYEYFANWDFTGKQRAPVSTWYSRTPDGTSIFDEGTGQEFLENVRAKETIWRLFFNAETSSRFTPAYEWHDGQEHVRIWRVEA